MRALKGRDTLLRPYRARKQGGGTPGAVPQADMGGAVGAGEGVSRLPSGKISGLSLSGCG
jgi:hypothetical protein